jgi:transcriptional regulator with GAF, ATPase, and Fis domain
MPNATRIYPILSARPSLRDYQPSPVKKRRFDELLGNFVVSLDTADSAHRWVDEALRSVGECIGVDRAEVFSAALNGSLRAPAHSWAAEGCELRLPLERSDQFPWLAARVRDGNTICFASPRELGEGATVDRDSCERQGIASALVIPFRAGSALSVLCLTSGRSRGWPDRGLERIRAVAGAVAAALAFARSQLALSDSLAESGRLCEQLAAESIPRPEPGAESAHRNIVGRSSAIRRALGQAEQVASTASSVLLLGETGTGKELLARAIHDLSERRARAMVKVNCAALPPTLIEAELFGRERGAYTGALSRQDGRFEIADGSTIFLDEIADLAPEVQVKLLRVLQEGDFERIGSTQTRHVDVRVIAATNCDVAKAVREGRFREDLYYRLNVFPIRVPALRERREDIPLLVWAFVQEFAKSLGRPVESIRRGTMEALQSYSWPGNVRELRNVVERAMILHRGPTLRIDIPEAERADASHGLKLEEVERRHVVTVLEMSGWRIRGKNGAAETLGLKPTTLESRLEKLGIRRPPAVAVPP